MSLPIPLPLQIEEQELIAPREQLSISECAEQFRVLSQKTSHYEGRWSNERSPFAVEIMDALGDVYTREVWLQKCGQSSGTEIGLNFLNHIILENPGPTMNAMPSENEAKKRFRTRIKPMFETCERLRRHLPRGRIENLRIGQETELDNMFLYICWAGSPATMGDVAIKNMILDEVAKYPTSVRREAGAIDLLRDRLTTYASVSKLYGLSTPILAGDAFDLEFQNTDQRQFWLKCKFCGQYHISRWEPEYVHLEKDSVGHLLSPRDYASGKCSWYVCPHCEKKWDEFQRWQAVCDGRWAPRDCKVNSAGRIEGKIFSNPNRGYHISAFMLYPGFMTIPTLAVEWAKADIAWKSGDSGPKQNFINSRCGEPWEEKEKQTEPEVIRLHIGGYSEDAVPTGVQMITAGIDVQLDHIWYAVLGWGYMSEVWSIIEGRLETGDTNVLENYDLVRKLLNKNWPVLDKPDLNIYIVKSAIDCNYRPDQVKDFCTQCTEFDIVPVRGDDTVKSRMFRTVRIEGTNLYRYDLNVNAFKDRLYRLLYESNTPGAGFCHLHSETNEETLAHLSSEEKKLVYGKRRAEKVWDLKREKLPNHLWDCFVYASAAAELAGVRLLSSLESLEKEGQRKRPKKTKDDFLSDLPEL